MWTVVKVPVLLHYNRNCRNSSVALVEKSLIKKIAVTSVDYRMMAQKMLTCIMQLTISKLYCTTCTSYILCRVMPLPTIG